MDDNKILEFLKEHGQPIIYGSYELDLMYRNDIDIILETDDLSYDVVLDIQKELIIRGFNHFWIFDNRKGGSVEDPKCIICTSYIGYYDNSIAKENKWELGLTICSKDEAKKNY